MPTYQYACTQCDHGFEAVQSFTDDALTECPACTGRLRKVFGAVGIVFKGSGFYRNDSRESAKAEGSQDGTSGTAEKSDKPEKVTADKGNGGSKSDGGSTSEKGGDKKPKTDSPAASGSGPKSSDSGGMSMKPSSSSSSTAGSAA